MKPPARQFIALATTLFMLASCGSESDPGKSASKPSTSATPHADVEVLDAVLVVNDDGSATLSAQIVNHTDTDQEISDAYVGEQYGDGPTVRVFRSDHNVIAADGTATTGGEDDPATIRMPDANKLGDSVPLSLEFRQADSVVEAPVIVPLQVPVVERSPKYDAVVGNEPNTAIKVEHARITVLPGQRKAYVDGTVVATISDGALELPTAVDADGKPVRYRHQTATGGPYGIEAVKGERTEIGSGPPYQEGEGDADYFNAKDVTVGETITVTIPFQSGDVIVPFKVVAG